MDLYCRLYIQSNHSEDELNDIIANIIGGKKQMFSIVNDVMIIDVRKNDYFETNRSDEEEGFVNSRNTAEIFPVRDERVFEETLLDPVDEEGVEDKDTFLEGVFHLIMELRKHAIVVAACEYEDLIVERTGWNWSKSTPIPPSV